MLIVAGQTASESNLDRIRSSNQSERIYAIVDTRGLRGVDVRRADGRTAAELATAAGYTDMTARIKSFA
jgi:hypothetical protein